MKLKWKLFFIFVLFVFCIHINVPIIYAETHHVPGDFPSLQDAINNAQSGDTILVSDGTYYEKVTVDKSVTILGSNAIFDGSGQGQIFCITASNVKISGFTLINTDAGIVILNSENCVLEENELLNCNDMHYAAIGIDNSINCIIRNNKILTSQRGIHIIDSQNITVHQNEVYIYDFGIRLLRSDQNIISDNLFDSSGYIGIQLVISQNNIITRNNITNCGPPYGGMWIERSETSGNRIYDNNFVNNNPQVTHTGGAIPSQNLWDNGEGVGNYWSDYEGEDTNDDGIADTLIPHLGIDYYPIVSRSHYEIPENEWLTFKYDHSGRSFFQYSNYPPYELIWKTSLGSNPSSVVHEQGKLYLGRMSTLEAYNASTGKLLWSTFLGARVSTPAIGEDAIYVSTWDTRVFALDKENGNIIWEYESEYELLDEAHGGFFIYPSPRIYGEQVFVGLSDGRMHAINIQDGSILWSYNTGSERHSSVAIIDDLVIFGTNGPRASGRHLYALNIHTGIEVWKKSLGGNIVSTPAIYDNICYVGSGNKIFALNVVNGATIWTTELNQRNSIESSPAVTEKYVIITGGEWDFTPPKGKLYCLSRSNGDILWSTGEHFARSSPSITGEFVIIGEYKPFLKDAKIFAFNITSGDKLWEYKAEAEIIYCNPSIGIERLYLASHDNFLYAFKPAELIIDEVLSPERVDVGTTQSVMFHVSWSHDQSDSQGIYLKINDDWFSTNETGWTSVETLSMESKKITWNITEIKTNSQHEILVDMPTIIWDQVKIEIPQIQRVNLNEGEYYATAYYEYDGRPFIGEIILNDTIYKPDVGKYYYKVMGIIDNSHGLTKFDSNDFELIFDRIDFEIECETPRLDVGVLPSIIVQGVYAFDGRPFHGSVSLNTFEEEVGEHNINIKNIDDPMYGLSSYSQNTVNFIWDQVIVELSPSDDRIDVGEEPEMDYTAYYEFDSQPFMGSISISTPSSVDEVGDFTYSVEDIEDSLFGLTVFSVEDTPCIWDRVKIIDGGVSKSETVVKRSETVWYKAEYEYDSEPFEGQNGLLYLNGEPMEWSASDQRWESEYYYDRPTTLTFKITGFRDDTYDLTIFDDTVGEQSIEWKPAGIPGFPFHSVLLGVLIGLIILLKTEKRLILVST